MALIWLNRLTKPALEAKLSAFRTFLFDIEGVVIKEGRVIPGSVECIKYLQSRAKVIVFTNSTSAREAWVDKLAKLGLSIDRRDVFTSGYVAAKYAQSLGTIKSVYCVGSLGLNDEFKEVGMDVIYGSTGDQLSAYEARPSGHVDAVIIGFDPFFNSYKLVTAGYYLQSSACSLIGTSPERRFSHQGLEIPTAGTQLKALEYFSKRDADVIVGKPNAFMLNVLRQTHPGFDPSAACMVGDRLDTDMQFAKKGGMHGLIVLSGDTTEQQAVAQPPSFISPSLGAMMDALGTNY